jgi:hypothetical protein
MINCLLIGLAIYTIYRGLFDKIDENSRKMYKNPRLWYIVAGIIVLTLSIFL